MRVVNFGSLNIDYVYRVDHFVQPGETMSAQSLQIQCGGKGLNQSVALARAGVETWHAGLIGPEGHFLKETLDRAGVHTRFVEESAGSTGHAIIQVDSTGQNSILLHDGANGRLTPDFVTAVLDQFSAGDTVLLQNETSCVEEIIHQAARRGMRTAMNAAPANEKLVGRAVLAVGERGGGRLSGGNGGAGGDSGHAGGAVPGDHCGADLGRTGRCCSARGLAGLGPSPENGGGGHHCGGRHLHRLLPAPGAGGRHTGRGTVPGRGGQRPGCVPARRGGCGAGI